MSANATVTHKAFDDAVIKMMQIPRFIDDYNYNTGGVDIANQYRGSYETHRTSWRNDVHLLADLDLAINSTSRAMYAHQLERGVKLHKGYKY
jgi:hypothetical protein